MTDVFRNDALVIPVNDDFERALKQFRKLFQNSGLLREIKKHEYALSKRERRKAKDRIATNRRMREKKKTLHFQTRFGKGKDKRDSPGGFLTRN
jgi:ribosomal protein S21